MVRINTDCFLIDKVKSLSFLTWDDRTKIKNELLIHCVYYNNLDLLPKIDIMTI